VVQVLGVRQVVQALVTGRSATPAVLLLGAEADLAHAATMIGLAALNRRYRRDALADAVIAVTFALAGVLAAREAATNRVESSELGGWRGLLAERLACRLVPGYDEPDRAR
jgi:hypothetical protein